MSKYVLPVFSEAAGSTIILDNNIRPSEMKYILYNFVVQQMGLTTDWVTPKQNNARGQCPKI